MGAAQGSEPSLDRRGHGAVDQPAVKVEGQYGIFEFDVCTGVIEPPLTAPANLPLEAALAKKQEKLLDSV